MNNTAQTLDSDESFNIELFDEDELSGTGILTDDAINNLSNRNSEKHWRRFSSYRTRRVCRNVQSTYRRWLILLNGESKFDSVLELANINPLTDLQRDLDLHICRRGGNSNLHPNRVIQCLFRKCPRFNDTLSLTVSARGNKTEVDLRDKSGERPELNGNHTFSRINPSLGLTWQVSEDHNFYSSYSESSRAPTPIELACNEGRF